jgi:lipid-binding SYLF domain-containing protein
MMPPVHSVETGDSIMRRFVSLRSSAALLLLVLAGAAFEGCSTAPKGEGARADLRAEVDATIDRFKRTDPSMAEMFNSAAGYAVFPTVGKGAVGVGGAHGRGIVFEGGSQIGFCDLTQATIGFQLGGQAYSELIFFQTRSALESFKQGTLAFSAQASAVAASAGAAATADYEGGVAVFTMAKGGLMYEASIGGQNFRFEPD